MKLLNKIIFILLILNQKNYSFDLIGYIGQGINNLTSPLSNRIEGIKTRIKNIFEPFTIAFAPFCYCFKISKKISYIFIASRKKILEETNLQAAYDLMSLIESYKLEIEKIATKEEEKEAPNKKKFMPQNDNFKKKCSLNLEAKAKKILDGAADLSDQFEAKNQELKKGIELNKLIFEKIKEYQIPKNIGECIGEELQFFSDFIINNFHSSLFSIFTIRYKYKKMKQFLSRGPFFSFFKKNSDSESDEDNIYDGTSGLE